MNNTVSWRHCFRDFLLMPVETTLELVLVGAFYPLVYPSPTYKAHSESSLSTLSSLTLDFELGGSCTVCCSQVHTGQLYKRVWLALS